jgi:hypothetical protein
MPLFHHDKEDTAAADAADPERYAQALASLTALPFAERAAHVFAQVAPAIDAAEDACTVKNAILPLLPDDFRARPDMPWAIWTQAVELEYVLHDLFQALYLARLVMRHESEYRGATEVVYRLSADGKAALAAGNAAEIIARRLPD